MPAAPTEVVLNLSFRGGCADIWQAREREVLLEGPRGTGKTFSILQLINQLCHKFPNLRVLIVRKYQKSLTSSCLRTFHEQVLHPGDGVRTFGGNDQEPGGYLYANGSRIYTIGMDDPSKVKSSEYDLVYINEVTELSEEDYESLLPLLRHVVDGKPVIAAQRIISDCNPDAASHWMNRRCEAGKTRRIRTTLADNPLMYDPDGVITEYGQRYLDSLGGVGGSRYDRWVKGQWTGVEHAIYPAFDRSIHIRQLDPTLYFKTTIIGLDYGATHDCAVVALSIDQFNRRWVRECWGQPDEDQGYSLNLTVSQFKERYSTRRGRGDPNQRYLNDRQGFTTASSSPGSRLHRTDLMQRLWYAHAGGRVPSFLEEQRLIAPQGPFAEPDSPGIFLVEHASGIGKLAEQIESYHWAFTDTPKGQSKSVFRDNDDFIAGVEYANEEWEEGTLSYINNTQATRPEATPHERESTLWTPRPQPRRQGGEYTKVG
jgi:hypothetical protein